MVNNNIILEYNSSDKFNLIQKNTQGGLYLSSNRIITSKASYDDIIFNLTGIIIVSPKEVNFNYDVENVKLVIIFIHKNDTNQLLLIHLPVLITKNSKPTIELSNFFKSIVNKSNLIQKKNKLHVDELLLNNISFGNKRPEIKVFNNNSKIHNYFKHEIFHKIKNYTSIISAIVSTNNNLITNDLFNKLHKLTNSNFYPKLFTNSTNSSNSSNSTEKNSFNTLLNNFGLKNSKIIEKFTSLREGLTPQDVTVQNDLKTIKTLQNERFPGRKAMLQKLMFKYAEDTQLAARADSIAAQQAAAQKAAAQAAAAKAAAAKAAAAKAAAAKAAAAKKAETDPSTYLNEFKKQAEDEATNLKSGVANLKSGVAKGMDNLSKDAKYANNPIQNINSNPTDKNGNTQDHIYMECRPTTTSNDSVINLIHRPSFSGLGSSSSGLGSSLSGLGNKLGGDLSGLGNKLGLGGGSGAPGAAGGSAPGAAGGSAPGAAGGSGVGGLGNKLGNELGSSYNSLSHLLGSIVDFLANCDIEYAIIGFGITLLILYLIHKLYQKAFSSKGEAANTLLDLSLMKAQAEPI